MSDISLETVTGKLNPLGYDAFMKSLRHAKTSGNRNVELAHWVLHILQQDRSDMSCILDALKLDRAKLLSDLTATVSAFRGNQTEMPNIAPQIFDLLDRGWHYATLQFGELQIRTGHLLVAGLKAREVARAFTAISPLFGRIDPDRLIADFTALTEASAERDSRPMDGTGNLADGGGLQEKGPKDSTALARFTIDMTAQAASGKMDPVVGREEEIRQIIDVLSRRRQNNPILTGEAGVGKTAVVEGFAQRIAAGDVPPNLRNVRLLALDLGLMQAGASMKGEFEQRLRSVIDEVQASPIPIILFIDEAHTLIGAGGAQGTGDAANLLKPALARGTLRTIGATTWSEYRQYFEKDPALTRRFQPVRVEEPSIEKCCYMLRGILGPMEKHHGVRISDAALVAAVELSVRYIPARQLPDKAVSLLDTACARVAISQTSTPAAIEDLKVSIMAAERELGSLEGDRELGTDDVKRVEELKTLITERQTALAAREEAFAREKSLVERIVAARRPPVGAAEPDTASALPTETPETETPKEAPPAEPVSHLADLNSELAALPPDGRMVYPHVDEQAVATIVSAWTGIPVGRMVQDEIQSILDLPALLNKRVIGQSHGIDMIARRIAINRARLDNPNKPIGVFMLCGPSGVGKTETALALAEAIYGGEQNIITINMSEFQEAHSVSLLKGSPPGYVGYGEGGRLTEAVRRKPYSAVLLDEVEKAHPDVHELFFQVFDKGRMEDGTGREIDFKNTLIILTSNVGTEVIMEMTDYGRKPADIAALDAALRPHLLSVFPPALLGRIVVIPYVPLSPDMMGRIVRLQLDHVGRRVETNYGADFSYSDAVVDHIVSQCNEPDSGGRMIDNIIMNRMLPDLAKLFLARAIEHVDPATVTIDIADGAFHYEVA